MNYSKNKDSKIGQEFQKAPELPDESGSSFLSHGKPGIGFDTVRCQIAVWGETRENLQIDLKNRRIGYLKQDFFEHNNVLNESICSEHDLVEIFGTIEDCAFSQWEEHYVNGHVLDGTSWNVQLLKNGSVVKEMQGENAYPPSWRVLEFIKNKCAKRIASRDHCEE